MLVELTPERFDQIGLDVDVSQIAQIECRGVIVCCQPKDGPTTFKSRFFAPRFGVPEDPVTGSAHCVLAPYFARKLHGEQESVLLRGWQASARGGAVSCRVERAAAAVYLSGQCVSVAEGTFC
eukprot:TRINITY_DN29344_c0_g1_i1.p1 TRINITY_DN29344_c0_g1~~TRINITY_DN29344_c0_g1_i1.p1  ORF type:complete len:123 (-),score=24.94 TRINITY_DN29344_c0_g1_i1:175-543(-)